MFVEEFFGILRNTLGIPIFVPWLQGIPTEDSRLHHQNRYHFYNLLSATYPSNTIKNNNQKTVKDLKLMSFG
jgi:hypothetical protein